MRIVSILTLLVVVAVAGVGRADDGPAGPPAATSTDPTPPLRPRYRYNGLNRAAFITVAAPTGAELADRLEIVLLTWDGAILGGPVAVGPGEFDLAAAFPMLYTETRAFYAQLLVNGAPAGSPLVVQPLIERPVMYTRPDTRPDGTTTYTRITGWGDDPESLLPEDERGVSTTTPTPTGDPDTPPQPSGVRLYVEQDVILETELGDIRFSLRPDEAPNTAWNFLDLARHGFYRDTVLHRIVPLDRNGNPFVLQGGDPTATGDGGPGYWLPLEPSRLAHDFGVLSMARADDPDSAGSQYFIALSRAGTARLDGQYCAFGYAVLGGDVIKRLAQVEIADPARGRPVQPPAIRTARLVAAPSRAPGIGRPDRRVEADLPEPDITPAKPGRDRVPR